MKGQGNGGRGVCSPDRGGGVQDKRSTHNTNANANHHHNGKNNNNGGGSGGGGSGSSETALDMKKGGTSPGSEAVPIVWPPKFVIGLTNKEKEEDFLAIKGSKLPQRPKKRAKFIQRTINVCLSLSLNSLSLFFISLNLLIIIKKNTSMIIITFDKDLHIKIINC